MLGEVRKISDHVFGAPFRLEIAAGIHRLQSETFTTAELQAQLDAPLDKDNNAGRNLKRLEDAGLLDHVGALWHRLSSPLWEFCDAWYVELTTVPDPAQAPAPQPPVSGTG